MSDTPDPFGIPPEPGVFRLPSLDFMSGAGDLDDVPQGALQPVTTALVNYPLPGLIDLPLAQVDAAQQAAFADFLQRVVPSEGGRTVGTAQWHRVRADRRAVVADIEVWQPVECRFMVSFDLVTHRAFLARVAAIGGFGLTAQTFRIQPDGSPDAEVHWLRVASPELMV